MCDMATVAEVLSRFGVEATEDDLAAAVEQVLVESLTPPATAALTRAERQELQAGGLDLDAPPESHRRGVLRTTAAYVRLVAESLTTREAAELLGVDPSRVRHRIALGELWALAPTAGQRRLPRLQFTAEGTPMPGLAAVLRALPRDAHPLTVLGFLTSVQPDLELEPGHPVTPLVWLSSGGNPDPVSALAADIHQVP